MTRDQPLNPPLGLPGQESNLGLLPSDRGDELHEAIAYQVAIGALLLIEGIAKKKGYVGLWCEHHEDFLTELEGGLFEPIQVKTKSGEGAKWNLSDPNLVKSVKRFTDLESQHGEKISSYLFISNAPPFIPAPSSTGKEKNEKSPIRLVQACREAASPSTLPPVIKTAFYELALKIDCPEDIVFKALRKLSFRRAMSLIDFRESLTSVIAQLEPCKSLSYGKMIPIRDELLGLVRKASESGKESLDIFSSVISANGKPEASIRGKYISIETAEFAISAAKNDSFRYAESGLYMQLGSAHSHKDVLLKKMKTGYVGSFFEPVWMQAVAAEQRMLERALAEPENIARVADQISSVVLVECKNAEAMASLEEDDRKRGLLIYQEILKRTELLSSQSPDKVEGEPAETLRGIAGLLSGSCKFAWGAKIDEEKP